MEDVIKLGGLNNMKIPNTELYTVRFTYIKNETIYLEHTLYASDRDLAIMVAQEYIGTSLGIHPDRLVFESCI